VISLPAGSCQACRVVPRWSRPPQVDETGRFTPEERRRARRRVLRSLAATLIVAVAAGLLAYGCSRVKSDRQSTATTFRNVHLSSRLPTTPAPPMGRG
jgi:ferric-dicitrate binding protein FerR (iron transport regulator)